MKVWRFVAHDIDEGENVGTYIVTGELGHEAARRVAIRQCREDLGMTPGETLTGEVTIGEGFEEEVLGLTV